MGDRVVEGVGIHVCSNDFSRCQECHGGRHDTHNDQIKSLFGPLRDRLAGGRYESDRFRNAVTTSVVTTNSQK
ncbi:hypothetical protein [Laspinema palackyanum]|uniref:hypothetical protein n=1 Tax=Laspinema palackyanum TaxID=3231601 RepID=UPI00345CFCC6|nr:hypothetical protein [Laspinema sp. D2c]